MRFPASLLSFLCLYLFVAAPVKADLVFTMNIGPLVDESTATPLGGASLVHSITIPETGNYVGGAVANSVAIPITSWTVTVSNATNAANNGTYSVSALSGGTLKMTMHNSGGFDDAFFDKTVTNVDPVFTINDGTQFNVNLLAISWTTGLSPTPGNGNAFTLTAADFAGLAFNNSTSDDHLERTTSTSRDVDFGAFGSITVSGPQAASSPEPSSLLCCALAAVGAGFARLRKRRRVPSAPSHKRL